MSHLYLPRNRKDHYLPRGYLRGFIDPARAHLHRPLWCLNRKRNLWEQKSPAQIGYKRGFYDFANDAIDVEHADVTFKSMEDDFPELREGMQKHNFEGWKEHLDFFCRYMQMIRARSPLYFEQMGANLAASKVATVTSVDPDTNSLTIDS